VHAKGPELHIYTENDGLESEIIHDVTEGTDGQVWVATSHGVGRFDGAKWTFPHEGDVLRVKATSLARDRAGSVFVGATTGLIQCNAGTTPIKLDPDRMLDNSVIDLAVDRRGRVWVLTEKGISIVDR
jgi:ligand-binding sensor domain-containing protein